MPEALRTVLIFTGIGVFALLLFMLINNGDDDLHNEDE